MTRPIEFRRGEAAVAAALFVVAGYVIWAAREMPMGSVSLPGPGFFPLALGAGLALLSAGFLARLWLTGGDRFPVELGHAAIGITFIALLAVAFAFESVGALPVLGVLLAVLARTFAPIAPWKAIVFGAAGAALTWLVFVYLLGVTLPSA